MNDDENQKYPKEIQELFAPKLPLVWIPPIDHEMRRTAVVTPISQWRSQYTEYLTELNKVESEPKNKTTHQLNVEQSRKKKIDYKLSFARQLADWNNIELLQKADFMKDPFKSVFVSRLDFKITEIELSKLFTRFGSIDSIRIIRDKEQKSRGYAFIVFENAADADNCVSELSRTGLRINNRTALVDIERGRIIRSWKPRRLGGGLGGRHYTKPGTRFNVNASAAASGRRYHIANNPTIPQHILYPKPVVNEVKEVEKSVKDKYAKYMSY